MKVHEIVKDFGIPRLSIASDIIGESTQTLNNWLKNKPFVFYAVVNKAAGIYKEMNTLKALQVTVMNDGDDLTNAFYHLCKVIGDEFVYFDESCQISTEEAVYVWSDSVDTLEDIYMKCDLKNYHSMICDSDHFCYDISKPDNVEIDIITVDA